MRISDWSSDVCSSDLGPRDARSCALDRRKDRRQSARGLSLSLLLAFGCRAQGRRAILGAAPSPHREQGRPCRDAGNRCATRGDAGLAWRSEEHTSELQSLMRISYAVFCLNKKITTIKTYTK